MQWPVWPLHEDLVTKRDMVKEFRAIPAGRHGLHRQQDRHDPESAKVTPHRCDAKTHQRSLELA